MVQIALKSIPRLLVQDHTTDFQSSTHFADCVQNLSCETGFEEKGFGGKGVWWKGGDSSGRSDLVERSGDQNLVEDKMADDRESQEEEAPIQPPIDSESWCRSVNTFQ